VGTPVGTRVETGTVPPGEGVLFLEIDGLAESVLRRALARGVMPSLARWLAEGSHRLAGWECDLSSQTSASQAGILLGSNRGVPAFRWYEKATGRVLVSNHPRDAAEIERRLSRGTGLLAPHGASRGNLVSGDAESAVLTLSRLSREGAVPYRAFLHPRRLARTLAGMLADVARELRASLLQRLRDERPRVGRGGVYPLLRACVTVALRDLTVATLLRDLRAGVPAAYATFVGYDEVAHHSGVERPDALDVLRGLDRQFAHLERAAARAPRPYRLVVLSDHGQSQGPTFEQRYGATLAQVVRDAAGAERAVGQVECHDEAWAHVAACLHGVTADAGHRTRAVARWLRRRLPAGAVGAAPGGCGTPAPWDAAEPGAPRRSDVLVLASGNLGLVYCTAWRHRLSLEELAARCPRLVSGLVGHPGIGFVMVRSARRGPLAIGAGGVHELATGRVEGEDPLAGFGPRAAGHLRRHDGFPDVPDVLVCSRYDPATGEVTAFEELVGSHGGLGGDQCRPFVLYPSDWPFPARPIVGAEQLHLLLKEWLAATAGTRRPSPPRAVVEGGVAVASGGPPPGPRSRPGC
jgi:hypothetical protein